MSNATKRMLIGSIVAAGIVAVTAAVDLCVGFPYSGQTLMDILFLVGAALVGYLGWDTYRELS